MNLPDSLIESVKTGSVVLFLGAGASRGSKNRDGAEPPLGYELKDHICDRFLGGRFKDETLSYVSELAASETDLVTLQEFIASKFAGLHPAPFHTIMPTFPWRALVTTNYDRLIETIYDVATERAQRLEVLLSDKDRIDDKLRSPNTLALLKLHGCVTRTQDPELPLILTTEQYLTHRENRKRLFQTFEHWAYERPVVFIGHELRDPDLRAILLELSHSLDIRPRYYLVKPRPSDEEKRFWETKKVSLLDGTLENFLESLSAAIPKAFRPLLREVDHDHPIQRHFITSERVQSALEEFLLQDVEYVHRAMPIEQGNAKAFYRGFDLGWYAIEQKLDVRRKLTDVLLYDVIIRPDVARPTTVELYAIKAEAGAGKSVFLKRLAWEAATEGDQICVFLRRYGVLRYEPLLELSRISGKRIFLFIDHAADYADSIANIVRAARKDNMPLTVITAERINTWNTDCERLEDILTDQFPIKYLGRSEIIELVKLLEKSDSLGPLLQSKSFEERVLQFERQAGRQLLVALHEATLGKPFEEILLDEFSDIRPTNAQALYLTVCVLNRLHVPVRAGLIARVHRIPFEEFRSKLFAPLEHVVQVHENRGTKDYLYSARHPEIAQIVFERVLNRPEDRYNEYIRIIRELNTAYTTDRDAFRGLIRAKAILDLFPSHNDAKAIFDVAELAAPTEAYVFQQRANYERIRPDGNFGEAHRLLAHARQLDPRDATITHTLAEVLRTQAEKASKRLERDKYRLEAKHLLSALINDHMAGRYARHTMVKIALDELRDTLRDENATEREIDNDIRRVEEQLARWLQDEPNDAYLRTTEADFARLLRDDSRALTALKNAFAANPRDPYVASRLAKLQEQVGEDQEALSTLEEALNANRGDKQINFRYAMVSRRLGKATAATLAYHLRRAFTTGDSNHEAQFWCARYLFESTDQADRTESKVMFRRLRLVPMEHSARMEIREIIMDGEKERVFTGTISRLEITHGFVERDGIGDELFFHRNNVEDTFWQSLKIRGRVAFTIGFNYSSAVALHVQIIEG